MKEILVTLPIQSEDTNDEFAADAKLPGIQCECGFEGVILCRYGKEQRPETLSLVRGVHCPACGRLEYDDTIDSAKC